MAIYDVTPDPVPAADYLTVVVRDDGPMAISGDSPSYRSVRVYLTPEQRNQIQLRATYFTQGDWHREKISGCFLENNPVEQSPNAIA